MVARTRDVCQGKRFERRQIFGNTSLISCIMLQRTRSPRTRFHEHGVIENSKFNRHRIENWFATPPFWILVRWGRPKTIGSNEKTWKRSFSIWIMQKFETQRPGARGSWEAQSYFILITTQTILVERCSQIQRFQGSPMTYYFVDFGTAVISRHNKSFLYMISGNEEIRWTWCRPPSIPVLDSPSAIDGIVVRWIEWETCLGG